MAGRGKKRDGAAAKKLLPCALWDFAGIQDWLNEQARAGYVLEKWPGWSFMGWVRFRRDPQAVHTRYCLDPIGERLGDGEMQDRAAAYREFGWRYADKIGRLYAIYRCDDPQAPALYSDPDSLYRASKKQMRWVWVGLAFWLLWAALLFRDEWPLLFRWPAEFLMELILRAEILIPLYGILLILVADALSSGIGVTLGLRRSRACLRQGKWPPAGPRRYPEFRHWLLSTLVAGAGVLFLAWLGLSGAVRTEMLSGPEEWGFPHVTLEETLPAGSRLRAYSQRELLHSDTMARSLLAPEQYDVAQGGMVTLEDGTRSDTRLYQESVRTLSPALARAVYRGRVEAHRHSLEEYRISWEENTSTLHPDLPTAYDYTQEETLPCPGLEGLTRFVYQFSDKTVPNTVYIGLAGDRVFVLNCSGAAGGEAALELLLQRLGGDGG